MRPSYKRLRGDDEEENSYGKSAGALMRHHQRRLREIAEKREQEGESVLDHTGREFPLSPSQQGLPMQVQALMADYIRDRLLEKARMIEEFCHKYGSSGDMLATYPDGGIAFQTVAQIPQEVARKLFYYLDPPDREIELKAGRIG